MQVATCNMYEVLSNYGSEPGSPKEEISRVTQITQTTTTSGNLTDSADPCGSVSSTDSNKRYLYRYSRNDLLEIRKSPLVRAPSDETLRRLTELLGITNSPTKPHKGRSDLSPAKPINRLDMLPITRAVSLDSGIPRYIPPHVRRRNMRSVRKESSTDSAGSSKSNWRT